MQEVQESKETKSELKLSIGSIVSLVGVAIVAIAGVVSSTAMCTGNPWCMVIVQIVPAVATAFGLGGAATVANSYTRGRSAIKVERTREQMRQASIRTHLIPKAN